MMTRSSAAAVPQMEDDRRSGRIINKRVVAPILPRQQWARDAADHEDRYPKVRAAPSAGSVRRGQRRSALYAQDSPSTFWNRSIKSSDDFVRSLATECSCEDCLALDNHRHLQTGMSARKANAYNHEEEVNLALNGIRNWSRNIRNGRVIDRFLLKLASYIIVFMVIVLLAKALPSSVLRLAYNTSDDIVDRLVHHSLERLISQKGSTEDIWADHTVLSPRSTLSIDVPATFQSRLNAHLAPIMSLHESQIWGNDPELGPICRAPEVKLIAFSLKKSSRLPAVFTFDSCDGNKYCTRRKNINDIRDVQILVPEKSSRFMFHIEVAEDRPGNDADDAAPRRYEPWGRFKGSFQVDLSDGGKLALQRYCGENLADVDHEAMKPSNVRLFTVLELKRLYKLWNANEESNGALTDEKTLFRAVINPQDHVFAHSSLAHSLELFRKSRHNPGGDYADNGTDFNPVPISTVSSSSTVTDYGTNYSVSATEKAAVRRGTEITQQDIAQPQESAVLAAESESFSRITLADFPRPEQQLFSRKATVGSTDSDYDYNYRKGTSSTGRMDHYVDETMSSSPKRENRFARDLGGEMIFSLEDGTRNLRAPTKIAFGSRDRAERPYSSLPQRSDFRSEGQNKLSLTHRNRRGNEEQAALSASAKVLSGKGFVPFVSSLVDASLASESTRTSNSFEQPHSQSERSTNVASPGREFVHQQRKSVDSRFPMDGSVRTYRDALRH